MKATPEEQRFKRQSEEHHEKDRLISVSYRFDED